MTLRGREWPGKTDPSMRQDAMAQLEMDRKGSHGFRLLMGTV
jgi:hypothetical protein